MGFVLSVVFVFFPESRIVVDIHPDVAIITVVPQNMVVISPLPNVATDLSIAVTLKK